MWKLMNTRLALHKLVNGRRANACGSFRITEHRSLCRQVSSLIQIKYMHAIRITHADLRSRQGTIAATPIRRPMAAGEPDAPPCAALRVRDAAAGRSGMVAADKTRRIRERLRISCRIVNRGQPNS